MKTALNILILLMDSAKKKGKGHLGRGKICVKLIDIIADFDKNDCDRELSILNKFSNEFDKPKAYQKLDKDIHRFLKNGSNYPHELIGLNDLEKSVGTPKYNVYLSKMSKFCDDVLDKAKCELLVYTLLEIMRQDSNFTKILYGNSFIEKEQLFGNYAHQKKICIEAFLLGLLYHTHKNWAVEKSGNICLTTLPDRFTFQLVRWENEDSLNSEITLNLKETLFENAKHPYTVEGVPTTWKGKIYPIQIRCGDEFVHEISTNKNAFLYGLGGIGKTTYLLNLIKNNESETVYFYFPLYKYHKVFLRKFTDENCYLLTQILLKYFFQLEYQTIESAIACEGEDTLIQQLTKLNKLLKNNPDGWQKKYVLLLDGMNEMSSELQDKLMEELERINHEWKNVRLIITGRTFPDHDAFSDFEQYELHGLPSFERDKILSEKHFENLNPSLLKLLKNPLFLNIYLENHNTANDINTQGEILDYYVENYKINTTFDKIIIQFLIKFALPFAAKSMSAEYDLMTRSMSYEIDRGTVSKAIDKAFDFYIETEMVYQNFIAPNGIRKNSLLECREKYDFVEILIENTCFLKASEVEPHKLHFTHQYFRDYFMAKYFLNLISTIEIVYNSHIDEKVKMFNKYDLGSVWLGDNDFEIYTLIGEICGDYKNIYSDAFIYTETILDKLLDMSRQFNTFRTTENVINTMSAVRGNVICGVNFSDTSLPLSIPRNLKFSMNGDEPCRFNGCRVMLLEILYDYDGKRNANWYDDLIDERLTPEILAGLGNFRNCDFTNAIFENEDYVDLLKNMGAITDAKKC